MTLQELVKERRSEEWRDNLRKATPNKVRTTQERMPMPLLDDVTRMNSMSAEVNLGFSLEEAMEEARRCLDCPTPGCVSGCPVNIHIPTFIKNIERGEIFKAASIIRETSLLSDVCSRVCPHENQCEGHCVYPVSLKKRAVAIGPLERFATEYTKARKSEFQLEPSAPKSNGRKIAVVGSGPAGLAFAHDMALWGYSVTVFEALHVLGGVMRYGIPEFRLPRRVIDAKLLDLEQVGVHFVTNTFVGRDITYSQLKEEGYEGFFIAGGTNKPKLMGIPGEDLPGVMTSYEYLMRATLYKEGDDRVPPPPKAKSVAIIGGGNTSMDVVRIAKRLGAERAVVIYRRNEEDMPASLVEIHEAKEEGAEILPLHTAIAYYPNETGQVARVDLQRMQLSEPNEEGYRSLSAIEGDITSMDIDLAVVSIGAGSDSKMFDSIEGLRTNRWGNIEVDENGKTSVMHFYAGGDVINGGATVVRAMGDGRKAALAMRAELESNITS